MRKEGIFAIFFMAACIFTAAAAADAQERSASDQDTLIGMANPSAVWAEQMGYQYLTRTDPDGSQYGVCILPDGSEHDAWELFRQSQAGEPEEPLIGMPDPSAVWAEQMGYQYLTRTNPDGSQYGVCILPDGSEHGAWELFRQSQASEPEEPLIGMPDPSAVWAEQMGYQYFTRINPDGSQYGACILPDGSEHDAWRSFRDFSGISRPDNIPFIHPTPSREYFSPNAMCGQSPFGARLTALNP